MVASCYRKVQFSVKRFINYGSIVFSMKIIDQIEEDLLELTPQERIDMIRDIGYFISCAAQMHKVENLEDAEADMKNLVEQADKIKKMLAPR